MYLSLGVALAAIGVAIAAWFRPLPDNKPEPAPTYSEQQVADAKANVCAAFEKVHKAVALAGARKFVEDPTANLAVATSTRQAVYVGGRYLAAKLAEEPATPLDLAHAVQMLTKSYEEASIDYLAEVDDTELSSLRRASDEAGASIESLCK